MGDEILPNYIGIIISQYKDPYKPICNGMSYGFWTMLNFIEWLPNCSYQKGWAKFHWRIKWQNVMEIGWWNMTVHLDCRNDWRSWGCWFLSIITNGYKWDAIWSPQICRVDDQRCLKNLKMKKKTFLNRISEISRTKRRKRRKQNRRDAHRPPGLFSGVMLVLGRVDRETTICLILFGWFKEDKKLPTSRVSLTKANIYFTGITEQCPARDVSNSTFVLWLIMY